MNNSTVLDSKTKAPDYKKFALMIVCILAVRIVARFFMKPKPRNT